MDDQLGSDEHRKGNEEPGVHLDVAEESEPAGIIPGGAEHGEHEQRQPRNQSDGENSSGYEVRDIGGPRGYERGSDRPAREYFAVICSRCGNAAQVPFKPRMDKPVYCSDCFRVTQTA